MSGTDLMLVVDSTLIESNRINYVQLIKVRVVKEIYRLSSSNLCYYDIYSKKKAVSPAHIRISCTNRSSYPLSDSVGRFDLVVDATSRLLDVGALDVVGDAVIGDIIGAFAFACHSQLKSLLLTNTENTTHTHTTS